MLGSQILAMNPQLNLVSQQYAVGRKLRLEHSATLPGSDVPAGAQRGHQDAHYIELLELDSAAGFFDLGF
jgi:hypothetical protein